MGDGAEEVETPAKDSGDKLADEEVLRPSDSVSNPDEVRRFGPADVGEKKTKSKKAREHKPTMVERLVSFNNGGGPRVVERIGTFKNDGLQWSRSKNKTDSWRIERLREKSDQKKKVVYEPGSKSKKKEVGGAENGKPKKK